MTVLRFDNVSKQYPGGQQALTDMRFSVNPGGMLFVTGHSGAGKSTLLKLIRRHRTSTDRHQPPPGPGSFAPPGPDAAFSSARPVENQETALRPVSRGVSDTLKALAAPDMEWPVYLHCTSGRDRTGVIVAAILLAIGIPRDVIVEAYLLSEGADAHLIERTLAGLAAAELPRLPVAAVLRSRLCDS